MSKYKNVILVIATTASLLLALSAYADDFNTVLKLENIRNVNTYQSARGKPQNLWTITEYVREIQEAHQAKLTTEKEQMVYHNTWLENPGSPVKL